MILTYITVTIMEFILIIAATFREGVVVGLHVGCGFWGAFRVRGFKFRFWGFGGHLPLCRSPFRWESCLDRRSLAGVFMTLALALHVVVGVGDSLVGDCRGRSEGLRWNDIKLTTVRANSAVFRKC